MVGFWFVGMMQLYFGIYLNAKSRVDEVLGMQLWLRIGWVILAAGVFLYFKTEKRYKKAKEEEQKPNPEDQLMKQFKKDLAESLESHKPALMKYYGHILPQEDLGYLDLYWTETSVNHRQRFVLRNAEDITKAVRNVTADMADSYAKRAAEHFRKIAVYFGRIHKEAFSGNVFPGEIWQKEATRFQHTYIIGKTRIGKTNCMINLILQDIKADRGIAVFSPQVDMLKEDLIPRIPRNRWDDIIYFDPTDERPIPFNPFELKANEELSRKADEISEIFRGAMKGLGGPVMEATFEEAIYALLDQGNSTIHDIIPILEAADSKQSARSLIIRVNRMLRKASVNRMLANKKNTIDLAEAMQAGKIILFNMSVGLLGDDASRILGQLLMSHLKNAIWSRESIPKEERKPFYVYVDECQNFISYLAETFDDFLSQAGKYHVGFYLAHQYRSQIESTKLRAGLVANPGTMFVMSVNADDAAVFAKNMELRGEEDRIVAEKQKGRGFIKIEGETHEIQTPLVKAPKDPEAYQEVCRLNRERYGITNIPAEPTSKDIYEEQEIRDSTL